MTCICFIALTFARSFGTNLITGSMVSCLNYLQLLQDSERRLFKCQQMLMQAWTVWPPVREKSEKFDFSSRSGKSEGILQIGQGNFKYQESQGKVREFHNFGQNMCCSRYFNYLKSVCFFFFSLARFARSKLWKLVNFRTFCAKKPFKDFICFICRIREVHFSELVKGICHLSAARWQMKMIPTFEISTVYKFSEVQKQYLGNRLKGNQFQYQKSQAEKYIRTEYGIKVGRSIAWCTGSSNLNIFYFSSQSSA